MFTPHWERKWDFLPPCTSPHAFRYWKFGEVKKKKAMELQLLHTEIIPPSVWSVILASFYEVLWTWSFTYAHTCTYSQTLKSPNPCHLATWLVKWSILSICPCHHAPPYITAPPLLVNTTVPPLPEHGSCFQCVTSRNKVTKIVWADYRGVLVHVLWGSSPQHLSAASSPESPS